MFNKLNKFNGFNKSNELNKSDRGYVVHDLPFKKLVITTLLLGLVACGADDYDPGPSKVYPAIPEAPEAPEESEESEEPEETGDSGELMGFTTSINTYVKSVEDISNPGRGFYQHTETKVSPYTALNKENLIANRTDYRSGDASYTANSTIILRAFILDDFINNSVLSSELLNNIQTDFETAREAGIKIVVRFYYHKNTSPPYNDPDKNIILAHIEQLKPILTNNSDVILAVQQGFIGAWGEQYYTDKFSPEGDVQGSYTDQNWSDRNEILAALLSVTDESTMIQTRTPQAKQKYIYGVDAAITDGISGTDESLTKTQAFSGEDIARIGFHNDCFLTDESDTGTYSDYGTAGVSSGGNPVASFKNYHKNDSQFVIVGGETCSDENLSTSVEFENNCSDGVVNTMDELNYSYLNADYNNEVNNDWTEGDNACMADIKNKLGYRLALTQSTLATSAQAGNYVPLLLTIDNDGFTSAVTPMELRLILKNVETGDETKVVFDTSRNDIRQWQPGTIEVGEYIQLPNDLAVGDYQLFLHIADVSNSGAISDRPEYSIQLANTGTWDAVTGYNNLGHTISVLAYVEGDAYNTEPTDPLIEIQEPIEDDEPADSVDVSITIDGNNADWANISTLATAEGQQAISLKVTSDETYLYVAIEGNEMGVYFDLFINSDSNTDTGFQSSEWLLSGADYLIEQGDGGVIDLFKSLSTAWSWELQGSNTIDANSSNSFVEFRIEKTDLAITGTTVGFGFNDVNSNWSIQSSLPLIGEAMVTYTMQ